MGRLSIEVSDAQHQKIKAMAALSGLSIKEYILQQTLSGSPSEARALHGLEALLAPRIAEAEASIATGRGILYSSANSLAKDVIARGKERLKQNN